MSTVLIIDDDYAFAAFSRLLLEDAKLSVQVTSNGAEGLQAAERARPDLILLDLSMPDMDGFEVLAALKARPQTAAIPVIICSMNKGEKEMRKGIDLGAVDYLIKPLSPQQSIPRIMAAIAAPRKPS